MRRGIRSRWRLRHLEDLFHDGAVGDLGDDELVDRFVRGRDGESAFAALVERHGPMVFRVCLQDLGDPHAAEDAAQATFLVLARQAGAIRNRASVSSWLFGVARRASARIRMQEARRRRSESRAAERRAADSVAETPEPPEFYPELHAEIDGLPERYRLPIVLCYFEGLTHDQAARRLRWPVGTVKTRLSRGRDRLRARLERHGRAPVLLPIADGPTRPGALAEIPGRLLDSIGQLGGRSVPAGAPCGAVSQKVIRISREVMKSMLIHKLRTTAVLACGLSLLGLGAIVAAQQAARTSGTAPVDGVIAETRHATSTLRLEGKADVDPETVITVRVPFAARVERVLVNSGEGVKKGQPLLVVSSAELAAAKGDYEVVLDQWNHDRKTVEYKKPLAQHNTIPQRELIDAEATESQSRLKLKRARDKLLLYGLTDQEIEAANDEDGLQKARMTLRAPGEGVVVRREAVQGNYYEAKDQLLAITSADHLSVEALVHPADLPRVRVGQDLTVVFPAAPRAPVKARVESVDSMGWVRTTIPNADRRYPPTRVRLEIEADPRREPIETPAASAAGKTKPPTTADRLDSLERKVDRLLDEAEERSSHSRILERLDALERKIDRLLEGRERKSP